MSKTLEDLDAAAAVARADFADAAARIKKLPALAMRNAVALVQLEGERDELVAAGDRPSREQRDAIEEHREQLTADDRIARTAPGALRELRLKAETAELRAAVEWARGAQRRMEEIAVELGRGPLLQAAQRLLGEVNAIIREAYRRALQLGHGAGAQAVRGWLDASGAIAVPVMEMASPEVLISEVATHRSSLFRAFLRGARNGNGNGHHGGA
jgi:hypothetical protein